MIKTKNLFIAAVLATLIAGSASARSGKDPAKVDALLNLIEPKTIFISSTDQSSNMGGLAGADLICQSLAHAPGSIVPEGIYVALLSTNDVAAASRLTHSSGPYVRPDGVPVAANWAGLFAPLSNEDGRDRDLLNHPHISELGVARDTEVWTGTSGDGSQKVGFNCAGWTGGGQDAGLGFVRGRSSEWLEDSVINCFLDAAWPIYCVQR